MEKLSIGKMKKKKKESQPHALYKKGLKTGHRFTYKMLNYQILRK